MKDKLKRIFGEKESLSTLLSAMLVMSSIGVVYIWSVFIIPLEKEFGWPRDELSLVFTFTMVFLSFGIMLGGFLSSRFERKSLFIAAIIAIATAITGTSYSSNLWVMMILYGIVAPLFMGITYNVCIFICNVWFPKDAATVSGLLQTCVAVSTIFFGYAAAGMLTVFDWRVIFRILGAVLVICLFVALKFMKTPEFHLPEKSPGQDTPATAEDDGMAWPQMIRTKAFWSFWFVRLLVLSGGVGTVGHAIPMALELGASYPNAVMALGVFSFCNGIGRIGYGIVWDSIGYKKTMFIDCFLFSIAFLLLILSSSMNIPILVIIAFALCGSSYGGANLIGISFVRTIFGMKHFSQNYGFATAAMLCSSFAGPYLMAEIKLSTQSYYYSFFLFAACGLVATLLSLLIKSPKHQ